MSPAIIAAIAAIFGSVIQIALTAFYYGKLTQATSNNSAMIEKLEKVDRDQWKELDAHGNRITRLESFSMKHESGTHRAAGSRGEYESS